MAENTYETDICQRLYEINLTEPRINAVRYFPNSLTRERLPLVVALPGSANYSYPATHMIDVRRNFNLQCVVGDWNEGILTETAQMHAEVLMGVIRDLYAFNRTRLELNRKPLSGVNGAALRTDVGIISVANKATLVFTLEINYRNSK